MSIWAPRQHRTRFKGAFWKCLQGKLIIDATCVPADIRYPTDLSLLNEASEAMLKIDGFCEDLPFIPTRLLKRFEVIKDVYEQQKYMYENKVTKVDSRIVSISQPHVRPIVRGKAGKRVEFGAKIIYSASKFVKNLTPFKQH